MHYYSLVLKLFISDDRNYIYFDLQCSLKATAPGRLTDTSV